MLPYPTRRDRAIKFQATFQFITNDALSNLARSQREGIEMLGIEAGTLVDFGSGDTELPMRLHGDNRCFANEPNHEI